MEELYRAYGWGLWVTAIDSSLSRESHYHVINNEETYFDAAELIEQPQAAVGRMAAEYVHENTGAIGRLDVCFALAKEDPDGRRMQQLSDGFFGLLNQTSE